MANSRNYCKSLAILIEQNAKMWSTTSRLNFKKNLKNKFSFDDFIVMDVIAVYKTSDCEFIAKILCKQKSYIEKIVADLEKRKLIACKNNESFFTTDGEKVYQDMLISYNSLVKFVTRFFTENDLETLFRLQQKLQNVMLSLSNSDVI